MSKPSLLLTIPPSSTEVRVMVNGDKWNDNDWEMITFKVKPGSYEVRVVDNCVCITNVR